MPQIDIQNLRVSFDQIGGEVHALQGVSFQLEKGESIGIVGESGSGKSVTCRAALGLLPKHSARITADALHVAGTEMLTASKKDLSRIRGSVVSMIFQDPMSAFDPMFTIGFQIVETLRVHQRLSKAEARKKAIHLLERVNIPHAEGVFKLYPHQLSGGMLQRAMLSMALSCEPELLIADEPTTALDVAVQAQILQLITKLRQERGMGLIMITHDLGVVAETVDNVVVMYGGGASWNGPMSRPFLKMPSTPIRRRFCQPWTVSAPTKGGWSRFRDPRPRSRRIPGVACLRHAVKRQTRSVLNIIRRSRRCQKATRPLAGG